MTAALLTIAAGLLLTGIGLTAWAAINRYEEDQS